MGNTLFSEYYTYNANDGTLTKVNTPGVGSVVNSYDSLKNLYKQQYTTKSNFQYARCYDRAMTDSGQIAPRVRGMAYYNGTDSSGGTIVGYRYGYDGDGNIKTIHNLGGTKLLAQYAYDAQNQLTDEYLYKADGTVDSHYQYSYDTAGNIQYVTIDDSFQIANYEYEDSNWGDLLTEYTGKKIAYEGQTYNATANTVTGTAISGNPINWYNGTAYSNLTWKNGRQLASRQKGGSTYTYAYDMNGIRSGKTVNGVKHNYITQNGKVIREEYGTTVLEFVYDTNGAPYALRYSSDSGKSWLTYYYVLNLQGDVVKLIYADGTVRAEYSYNAWGEILSATNPSTSTVNIQDINPLRYRGYYYDTETGWYYLQSRYYDPIVKRFLNTDAFASTGCGILGCNMFAYCNNCPVMASDTAGMRPSWEHKSGGTTQYTDTGTGNSSAAATPKPEPYKSADEAAKAFSEQVYGSSAYIRHEYSTEIYSRTIDGKTTYNYNPPRAGQPHSASVGYSTPEGTKAVAYAHTHPNSNVFSGADIRAAGDLGINAYVVGPNLKLQRYSLSSAEITNLGTISPIILTDVQRASLVAEFQASWDAHIAAGCDFGCENMIWPTP